MQESGIVGTARGFMLKILLLLTAFFLLPAGLHAQRVPFQPNDPYYYYSPAERPGFPGQWHLVNQAPEAITFYSRFYGRTYTMVNSGVDAGLRAAWNLGYTGRGVVIGIVDDGVDATNYDIAPGYRADLSKNFSDNAALADAPQGPQAPDDNHGTAVAGVAAARGGNGVGGTGAAPYASIAALRLKLSPSTPGDPTATDQNFTDAYYWKSGVNPTTGAIEGVAEVQVKNHSYGDDAPFTAHDAPMAPALQRTAVNGVIHVFAAGNARGTKNEDASKEIVHNSFSTITVAALASNGKFSAYSSYGSSVFVTAPSSTDYYAGFGITTTDRTGKVLGYNAYSSLNPSGDMDDRFPDTSYMSYFGGTSASAPLVSGIMVLGKEANPEMDVRMAKHALVRTSTVVDATDSSASSFGGWRTNGAGNMFNPNYGFGNINAGAFVETVRKVAYVTEQTSVAKSATFSTPIPDNDSAGVSTTFGISAAEAAQPLEGVEVGLTVTHERVGDLTAKVSSPSGMESCVWYSTSHLDASRWDTQSFTNRTWTFLTNAFWGENAAGTWTLNMADLANEKTGTWLGYNVTLLMGEMVLLTPGIMTQSLDINAQSLTVASPGTTYRIPAARTFRVRNNVFVDGGTLTVNGQITEAPGYQSIFILNSGTVNGTGAIHASRGFTNSGGTLSPGNSIGTITINGGYTQGPMGALRIEVASPASADLVVVNGAATLDGTLRTIWTGGYTPALNTTFGTILTATSGVYGQFSSLLTNITPTIVFKPRYDTPNQVYLVVERDYANQTLLSYLTPNQRAVGSMLNSVRGATAGDLGTVLTTLDTLPTYSLTAAAFEQLSPKGSDAMTTIGISTSSFQTGNVSERLSDLRYGIQGAGLKGPYLSYRDGTPVMLAGLSPDLSGMLPTTDDQRWGFFAKGNASYGDQKDRPDRTGYTFTNMGVTVGSDYKLSGNLIAGLMLGLNTSRADVDNMGSKVKTNSRTVGAYGSYYTRSFYADGSISYGFADYDMTRRIVLPGLDRTATASPGGNQITAYGGTGYDFRTKNWLFTPNMSLQYMRLSVDSYTEDGADSLNLNVDGQRQESLLGSIGVRASYMWRTDTLLVMPGVRTSWTYEFLRDPRDITSCLAQGSSPFDIRTPTPDRGFLSFGAGVTAFTARHMSFYMSYDVQLGENRYVAHNVNAGLRVQF